MARSIQSGALTRRQTENHRASIRTSELLNRLQDFACAEPDECELLWRYNKNGQRIRVPNMSREQIQAAVKVLDKSLPNLQVSENINIEEAPSLEQIKQRMNSLVMANPDLIEQLVKYQAEQQANAVALETVTNDPELPAQSGQETPLHRQAEPEPDPGSNPD